MGNTTFKPSNASKPAPRWWRKLEDGLLMILIPAVVACITGWGIDTLKSARLVLIVNVALVALIKFIGMQLANGEEYVKTENNEQ